MIQFFMRLVQWIEDMYARYPLRTYFVLALIICAVCIPFILRKLGLV